MIIINKKILPTLQIGKQFLHKFLFSVGVVEQRFVVNIVTESSRNDCFTSAFNFLGNCY